MGIFNINKRKKTAGKGENIDKSVNQNQSTSKVVSNEIKIKVYRSIGGGGLALASKYTAIEKKDNNNNLFAINEEKTFKEDLDFTQERIYEWINTDLSLQGRKLTDRAQKVKKKINEQEQFIKSIENNKLKNAESNLPDEQLKLRQYKIFYESLRKDSKGTYMLLEEGGIRTYYFKSLDGVLFPYWWGDNSMRIDPDLTTAKKIYSHELMIFNSENSNKLKKIFDWTSIIMLVIGVIFLGGGSYMTFHHQESMYSMASDVNQGNIKCTNTLAICTEKYEELSSKYMLGIQPKIENDINNEKDNNNIAQDVKNSNPLIKAIT